MECERRRLIGWRPAGPTLVAICALALATGAFTQDSALLTLSGRVNGGSGKHVIVVALWDAAGFLKKPVQEIRIQPQSDPRFQFHLSSGRWALSAYEDQNDNGVLDMGMFGPKEPSGFWRPFHAWRKPGFDDVYTQIDRNITDVEIKLHK
jgi:uncharacterized protein (DUF2141 family)